MPRSPAEVHLGSSVLSQRTAQFAQQRQVNTSQFIRGSILTETRRNQCICRYLSSAEYGHTISHQDSFIQIMGDEHDRARRAALEDSSNFALTL